MTNLGRRWGWEGTPGGVTTLSLEPLNMKSAALQAAMTECEAAGG